MKKIIIPIILIILIGAVQVQGGFFEKNIHQYIEQNSKYDYIIITSDDLIDSIISSSFINWKTLIGFNIKIVKIKDSEIYNQPGFDLAEQIRNFLREYYEIWDIKFLLIVGDIDTIPMRYCYYDPSNHDNSSNNIYRGDVPTDYYYADLTLPDIESWDLDGDGFYGEYRQDLPDFEAEIFVGRIPTNNPEACRPYE